nr:tyrosine-type recombinase/integrase [Taibaiella sp. KBW10]
MVLLLDTFVRYLRFEKRMSDHTIIAYKTDLSQFIHYMKATYDIEMANEVKSIHIRSWLVDLKELKQKERSLQRKISSLKSWFKFLLNRTEVTENPTVQITGPKAPKRLPAFLEQQQSEALFATPDYAAGFEGLTEELIMELLYQTGIRRAELIGLLEQDVDPYRKQIVVLGKRNKERAIPIGAGLLVLIKNYIAEKKAKVSTEHNFLLTLESGKPLYDQYVYRVVKKYLQEVTTLSKKSPHVLRHTFATHLTNNGANISAIKELLGHSSLAATQIYTHNNIEHLKKIYQQAHPKAVKDE